MDSRSGDIVARLESDDGWLLCTQEGQLAELGDEGFEMALERLELDLVHEDEGNGRVWRSLEAAQS